MGGESDANPWDELHAEERYCPRYPDDLLVRWTLRNFPTAEARGRALDLGCGAGRNAIFLAREGFETTASDLSEQGVARTLERAAQLGLRIDTQVAPIHETELPEWHFDAAVSYGVMCYAAVDEIAQALDRVARSLVQGGRFFGMTRAAGDWRQRYGTPFDRCRRTLEGMERTPAEAEEGMKMTLLDEETLRDLLEPFSEVQLDRRTVSWWDGKFVDDDWLISARR